MLCENCGKKDATSIYMSPKDNKLKYLCGACYRKINNDNELDALALKEIRDVKLEAKCLNCGETFNEFMSSGLFGCENCYDAFSDSDDRSDKFTAGNRACDQLCRACQRCHPTRGETGDCRTAK